VIEEHVWIRCNNPTCETRTPDLTDRVEARKWAIKNGWTHVHPSTDYCPEHSGNAVQPQAPAPNQAARILGVSELVLDDNDFTPEGRARRLEREFARRWGR
jgi:hypothetical protein